MNVAIMQPYLFPYLGYFQLIGLVNEFVSYDDVQFMKGGWINRNRMLVNGAAAWFTLSVRHADHRLPICARFWHDAPKDIAALIRRMETAYQNAPHFSETIMVVRAALDFPGDNVADSLNHALRTICSHLGLNTPIRSSRTLAIPPHIIGQDRVLEICARLGTRTYVNPPGGTELYDAAAFQERGLRLRFLKPTLVPYKQFELPFVPGLSIIDVLMFNDRKRVRAMLADYTFI